MYIQLPTVFFSLRTTYTASTPGLRILPVPAPGKKIPSKPVRDKDPVVRDPLNRLNILKKYAMSGKHCQSAAL
jgi:hypothetical protein